MTAASTLNAFAERRIERAHNGIALRRAGYRPDSEHIEALCRMQVLVYKPRM
jgi:hypothetical protein